MANPKSVVRLDTQGRVAVQIQNQSAGRVLLCLGKSVLVLFRPLTNWTRPTHIIEVNVLYPRSADLNVNLIHKNPFTETSRIVLNNYLGMIDNLPELPMTHHRNHHTPPGRAVVISGAGKGRKAMQAGGWLGQSLCQLEKGAEAHWGCGRFLLGSGAH